MLDRFPGVVSRTLAVPAGTVDGRALAGRRMANIFVNYVVYDVVDHVFRLQDGSRLFGLRIFACSRARFVDVFGAWPSGSRDPARTG